MKIKAYENEQLDFFPLYLGTVGINFKETRLKRINGFKSHQIFLVNSGNGVLKISDQTFFLTKNDLFYIAANCPHEYYSSDDNFKTTFISFFGDGFENIKKYYNIGDFGVYKNKNVKVFKASAETLYDNIDTTHEISTLCAMLYSTVIAYFNEACKQAYSPIEKVYLYIKENYASSITLDDILMFYPYSKTKLCNSFKEKYNCTIFEALTNIRLRQAKNMLCSKPELPLKTVAFSCGFNDVSYFCKQYKRFYNCSPKSEDFLT